MRVAVNDGEGVLKEGLPVEGPVHLGLVLADPQEDVPREEHPRLHVQKEREHFVELVAEQPERQRPLQVPAGALRVAVERAGEERPRARSGVRREKSTKSSSQRRRRAMFHRTLRSLTMRSSSSEVRRLKKWVPSWAGLPVISLDTCYSRVRW
jgi:hypothetical protein